MAGQSPLRKFLIGAYAVGSLAVGVSVGAARYDHLRHDDGSGFGRDIPEYVNQGGHETSNNVVDSSLTGAVPSAFLLGGLALVVGGTERVTREEDN